MNALDYSVYLVTDSPERYPHGMLANVEAAVAGGVTVVQYRATTGTRRSQYEAACALRDLLRPRGVPLVINDQVDLALAVDADGVHVGQGDLPVGVVRKLVGPRLCVGLSITAAAQLEAVPAGTDYLGAGPVFTTATKLDAAAALGLNALAQIVRRAELPVVAIGGIDLTNAAEVFASGVAGVAVVSAVSRASDPTDVVRRLREMANGLAR